MQKADGSTKSWRVEAMLASPTLKYVSRSTPGARGS